MANRLLPCWKGLPSFDSDVATDGLEQCLRSEEGGQKFRAYLEKHFKDDFLPTLSFVFQCDKYLKKIIILSPGSRNNNSEEFSNYLKELHRMSISNSDKVNFDEEEVETLRFLVYDNTVKDGKIEFHARNENTMKEEKHSLEIETVIEKYRNKAVHYLRIAYQLFRPDLFPGAKRS